MLSHSQIQVSTLKSWANEMSYDKKIVENEKMCKLQPNPSLFVLITIPLECKAKQPNTCSKTYFRQVVVSPE